jgi:hypothetical protein
MAVGGDVSRLKVMARPALDVRRLRQTYHCRAFHPDRGEFVAGHGVGTISLDGGALQVDDLPVFEPSLSHEAISWCQQVPGRFTSGHLAFDKGGTELHGLVFAGDSRDQADAYHVLGTTIQPVTWTTQITKGPEPAGTDPSDPSLVWTDGLALQIGYEQQVGDLAPHPVVQLDGQDITDMTSWTIDQNTQETVLLLNLAPQAELVCGFDSSLYLSGSAAFDQLVPVPTLSGTITATCADQNPTGAYLWKGTTTAAPSAGGSGAPTAMAAPAPALLSAADVVQDSSLQISELMTIVPDSSVSDEANAMIVENMKWAMSQSSDESGWLSEFFGEQPPVLPSDRQTLVNQSLTWYQGDFAKSYLGWAFANYAGTNAPSSNLNTDQKLKLKYFMQTGMAKEPDFSTQQNGVYLQAFVAAKPRLGAYIVDGGEKWAQALYGVITSPAQFILMVNRIYGAAGEPGTMTPANNFATLLSALEGPGGKLAGQYMHALMAAVLTSTSSQSTWSDTSTVMDWLPDFLQTLVTQIAQSGTVPDEATLLAQQIQQLQAQLGGSMATVAQELANFVINANGSNILQKTQNAETAFLQQYPGFGKIASGLFFIAWCGGIFMVVKAFQNWTALKPEDKAKVILTTVQLGLSAIDVLPAILSGIKSMGLNGWNQFMNWWNGEGATQSVQDMGYEGGGEDPGDWVVNGANETTPLFDVATQEVETAGTLWDAVFEGAGKVVGVIGVAASAAFAVLSTIDFVQDIESGQPPSKDAVDGIMAAANIGMTVCLVLDLVVASTIFAMAAAVFAVIGVIVAIVAMFVVKPANPLDDFMNNTVIPFVNGLPPQTPPPAPATSSSVHLAFA